MGVSSSPSKMSRTRPSCIASSNWLAKSGTRISCVRFCLTCSQKASMMRSSCCLSEISSNGSLPNRLPNSRSRIRTGISPVSQPSARGRSCRVASDNSAANWRTKVLLPLPGLPSNTMRLLRVAASRADNFLGAPLLKIPSLSIFSGGISVVVSSSMYT